MEKPQDPVEQQSSKTPEYLQLTRKKREPVIVIVTMLVFVCLIIYSAWLFQNNYREKEVSTVQFNMLITANATATAIKRYLEEHIEQLQLLAGNPEIQRVLFGNEIHQENESSYDPVKNLYEINIGDIDAVYALDAKGMVLVRYPEKPGKIKEDYSEKPGFKFVSEFQKPFVSESFVTDSGKNAISITVPVLAKERFLGALRWLIESDTIYKLFLDNSNFRKQSIWIIDDTGEIISHPIAYHIGKNHLAIHKEKYPQVDWSQLESILELIYAGERGVSSFDYHETFDTSSGPDKKIIAFAPLRVNNKQWTVGVTSHYADIAGPIDKHARTVFGFAGLIMMAFAGGGISLYRSQKGKAVLEAEADNLRIIAKTAKALKESEAKYLSLFEHMNSGFAYHKIIVDDNDKPIDYVFLEINQAFERYTGLTREIIGKKVTAVIPGIENSEPDLINIYGEVALSGKPTNLDFYFASFQKWYSVFAYSTQQGCFAVVFDDITERKKAEREVLYNYQFKALMNILPGFSLGNYSMEETLTHVIGELTSLSWLEVEQKGAIFLVEEESQMLVLTAQSGLNEPLLSMCAQVPYGKCLCGRAAQTKEIIYADCIDERHDIHYESMLPHGHYCVPIISTSDDRLLGVFSLYLKEDFGSANKEDEPALKAIASVLASIIERKRAEEEIQETKQFYENILENTKDGIWVTNKDDVMFYANRGMGEIAGIPPDQIIGARVLIDFPESTLEFFRPHYLKAKKMLQPLYYDAIPVITPSEHQTYQSGWLLPRLIDGNYNGMICTVQDITERKQAEEALQENIRRNQIILDSMPCIAVLIRLHSREIVASNKTATEAGILPGKLCYKTWGKGDAPCSFCLASQLCETGEHQRRDIEAEGKIWETYWIPVTEDLFLHYAFDITGKKEIDARLKKAQKMEAIGTLAGGIAHDFNNLLMGIQGYASLMLLEVDANHPFSEQLKAIEKQVESGSELTRQLLGFAHGGKYEVRPTDLNELIKVSTRLFARTRKEISLHTNFQDDIWTVKVDQGQIQQVMLNLFVNAWQAMFEGGELYLETTNVMLENDFVRPFSMRVGEYVRVSVTDTGSGMDEEIRTRIFEPFFTTRERDRGTGLGLASAYGIVKNHGGFIDVYSEPGKGSTFNIYLPATMKEAEKIELTTKKKIYKGTGTILFVDDEEIIRNVGEGMLKVLGYAAITAGSGQEAINIYKQNQNKIDLVILDMIMPSMSGKETFNLLRQINPAVKILVSSGYSIDVQAKTLPGSGCQGFLQKPFNIATLSQKLQEILSS